MALSKHQKKSDKDSQSLQDGEPVLTFHGPRMRKGHCISVVVEDLQVKYLVRYHSGGGGGAVADPPYAPAQQGPPATSQASSGTPAPEPEPEPTPSSSKAKAGPSKAGPGPGKVAKAAKVGRAGKAGTSKTGPSASRPSTSRAGPKSGGTEQSTSSGALGGAKVQGASSGKSREFKFLGEAGASVSSRSALGPSKEQLYPVVTGWEYEWIPENRVLRYSTAQLKQDSDVAIQIAVRKEQKRDERSGAYRNSRPFSYGESSKGDHSDRGEASTSSATQPPAKRSRDRASSRNRRPWGITGGAGDPKQQSAGKFVVQVNLPKNLKPLLVQDWELVTLAKKLFDLPAKITVDAILAEYATFPLNCRTRDKKFAVSGLVAVIQEYFNVILSTQLLYDFERPQHADLLLKHPGCQMSQLYGGAHLLRLFQQLGPMLSCTSLDDSSLIVLLSHLQDFLEYLASNPSLLFIDASDYLAASEEYLKTAE